MTGSVIIDGFDIYTAYNAILLRGGDIDLLTYPERKEPEAVSWFEKSGLDVDLSEVYYKEKTVTMPFYISSSNSGEFLRCLDLFYRLISLPGYRTIFLRSLQRSFRLRYVSCSGYEQRGSFSAVGTKSGTVTVVFAMDDPLQVVNAETPIPVGTRPFQTHVRLNGMDLSSFGIVVNNVYNTSLSLPAQKPVLVRTSTTSSGILADLSANTTFEPYDITIKCTMLAASVEEFYTNYSALFATLSSATALSLKLTAAKKGCSCYYLKQENFTKAKAFSSSVNVSFDIVLKSIDYTMLVYLLGTTSGKAIRAENGKLIVLG